MPMKITKIVPSDWKDLQDKVCKFLNEAGYPSESPKEIETVRGKIEVDVFSKTENEILRQFICECKFWNAPVPKEKVHAFRSVVSDSGSMLGIIISKNGFQSGAYEAANCTNVLLKSWDEFICLIDKQWIKEQYKRIKTLAHCLGVYTDHLDVPFEKLTEEKKRKYISITTTYLRPYLAFRELEYKRIIEIDSITVNGDSFDAIDNLFLYFEKVFLTAIKEYEEIFAENPIDAWKFQYFDYDRFLK